MAACGGQETPGGSTDVAFVGLDGAWELVSGKGPKGPVEVVELNRITLVVEDESGGSRSGCNWYGAGNWVEGEGFDFENAGMTAMGCAPDVDAAEQAYTEALLDVERATRTGGRLVLSGPASELVFKLNPPVSTDGLLDRTWILTASVKDGTATPAVGPPTTFRIGSDGSIEWDGPCGAAGGTWRAYGDEIDLPSWERGAGRTCRGPSGGRPTRSAPRSAERSRRTSTATGSRSRPRRAGPVRPTARTTGASRVSLAGRRLDRADAIHVAA